MTFAIIALFFVVSCGNNTTETTTPTTTTPTTVITTSITLPDLTGQTKSEISDTLDALGITYVFEYQTNTEIDEDVFVQYGNDNQAGDAVTESSEIVVIIATPRLILPDLTGMTQSEIIGELMARGILFHIEIVTDNDVPDQTFSSYADGLEAGDLVPSSYTITVNLGYNQTILPDLTGELKAEIESALTDLQISYEFSYIIDDAYPEDSFAGYVDLEVGDYYAEETTVTVNLYKNTFTDDATSLFISKYVDGGDGTSDQAIEIYNPTASAIDLSNYYLAIYINGSRTISYNIPLSDVS
ncbi:MAG TPA: PASTA domain-containing protein, partial [Bacillota bacterium]|nr:PASTA domain-containing protein [Bacillota bacterium]